GLHEGRRGGGRGRRGRPVRGPRLLQSAPFAVLSPPHPSRRDDRRGVLCPPSRSGPGVPARGGPRRRRLPAVLERSGRSPPPRGRPLRSGERDAVPPPGVVRRP